MNDLVLPESSKERKEAHERIIAQLLTRALLLFPTEEIDKEVFLSKLKEQYQKYEMFSQGLVCKWGEINQPVKLLKNLKDEPWEFEGVKKFYDYYVHKRRLKEEEMQKMWYNMIDLTKLKELVELFFSGEEETKNQATEKLKDIGIFALDDFLVEELKRVYNLSPLEFLEIYYQYFASTREEEPIGERPFR